MDVTTPETWRVSRVRRETRDTVTFDLEPEGGAAACGFAPGQFNMLYLPGIGEVPISVSGDPSQSGRLTHTVRAVGAVSRAIAGLRRGSAIGVRGPFGSPWPVAALAGGDVIVMAGGIGLAPLRPALYGLVARRQAFGRVALLYGARSPAEILYRKEIEAWRRRLDFDIHVTVDTAGGDWRGNVGVVTGLLARAAFDPEKTAALICGPEIMMRFAVRELARREVAEDRLFVSLERNMQCAVGFCGHCQLGPYFVCRDGPVFRYDRVKRWLDVREL